MEKETKAPLSEDLLNDIFNQAKKYLYDKGLKDSLVHYHVSQLESIGKGQAISASALLGLFGCDLVAQQTASLSKELETEQWACARITAERDRLVKELEDKQAEVDTLSITLSDKDSEIDRLNDRYKQLRVRADNVYIAILNYQNSSATSKYKKLDQALLKYES